MIHCTKTIANKLFMNTYLKLHHEALCNVSARKTIIKSKKNKVQMFSVSKNTNRIRSKSLG